MPSNSSDPAPPPSPPLDTKSAATSVSGLNEDILEAAAEIPVPGTPKSATDSDESWTTVSPPSNNKENGKGTMGNSGNSNNASNVKEADGYCGVKLTIVDDDNNDDEAARSDTSACTVMFSPLDSEESSAATDAPETPCPAEKEATQTSDAIFDKCTKFFNSEQGAHGHTSLPEMVARDDASDHFTDLSLSPYISETDELSHKLDKLTLQLTQRNNEIAKLKQTIQSLKVQHVIEKCELKEANHTIKIQKNVIKKLTDVEVTFLDRQITLKQVEEMVREMKYQHETLQSENERMRIINEKRNETLKKGIRVLGLACAGVVDSVDFTTLSVFLNSLDFEQKAFQPQDKIFTDENIRDIFWIDTPSPTTIFTQDIYMDAIRFWCGDYNRGEAILSVLYLNNKPDISNLIIDGLIHWANDNNTPIGGHGNIITFCQLVGILDLRYNIPSFDNLHDILTESIIPYYTTSNEAIELLHLVHLAAVMAWRRIGVRFLSGAASLKFVSAVKRLFGGAPPQLDETGENLGELLGALGIECECDVDVTMVEGVAGRIVVRTPVGRWVQVDCVGKQMGYVRIHEIEEYDATKAEIIHYEGEVIM